MVFSKDKKTIEFIPSERKGAYVDSRRRRDDSRETFEKCARLRLKVSFRQALSTLGILRSGAQV